MNEEDSEVSGSEMELRIDFGAAKWPLNQLTLLNY